MKGKELIEILRGYEDFDINFCIGSMKDNMDGCSWVTVKNIVVDDIGYSSKTILLGYNDELEGELEIKY